MSTLSSVEGAGMLYRSRCPIAAGGGDDVLVGESHHAEILEDCCVFIVKTYMHTCKNRLICTLETAVGAELPCYTANAGGFE